MTGEPRGSSYFTVASRRRRAGVSASRRITVVDRVEAFSHRHGTPGQSLMRWTMITDNDRGGRLEDHGQGGHRYSRRITWQGIEDMAKWEQGELSCFVLQDHARQLEAAERGPSADVRRYRLAALLRQGRQRGPHRGRLRRRWSARCAARPRGRPTTYRCARTACTRCGAPTTTTTSASTRRRSTGASSPTPTGSTSPPCTRAVCSAPTTACCFPATASTASSASSSIR